MLQIVTEDKEHVLLVNTLSGTVAPPSVRTAFRWRGGSLSVMMWVRVYNHVPDVLQYLIYVAL